MDSDYVFLCGVMWCSYGHQDAGKELMRAAHCEDPYLSALALAMLQEGFKPRQTFRLHTKRERTSWCLPGKKWL